ncbi:MAG: NDP-sugar synthase [Acidobacteria bacterium]|nr:NDP-sugar synthase [Acidobacteriota bacterium]
MRALILAGGEGTRLRPLTNTLPKPLIPICNRPFLEHQVRLLAHHDVREVILLTGYLHEGFPPFAERMSAEAGVRLEVSKEDEPLDTAGAVRSVLDRIDGTALVLNGDVLTDLDVGALVDYHRARGAALTIALAPVADASGYGLVPVDGEGKVEAFLEKPAPDLARRGGLINAGTYVIEPSVLAEIPPGERWSFERRVFPSLLERGEPVYGFASDSYWIDIGTPARYLQAHWDALDGAARVTVSGRVVAVAGGARALVAGGAEVGPGAVIRRHAVLGPDSRIEAGAIVEDCVLLEGARVEEGASARGSILGPESSLGAGRSVEGVVLAEGERA